MRYKNRSLRSFMIPIAFLIVIVYIIFSLSSCKNNQKKDTIVTLWHVYGAQTDSPLEKYVEEFNNTVGAEKNIRVKITSVSNTNYIHDTVLASAFEDPGASELPDMFNSYPKTVLCLPDKNILVDYTDYFTEDELADFVPEFIEEGMVNSKLAILPVAKSIETMFVNETAFNRFAQVSGAKLADLSTWEGFFKTVRLYREWTDSLTPEIENDGKIFFAHDYHFNYFQIGVESLGESFFDDGKVAFGEKFKYVWEPYAKAAINGDFWLGSGYATEPLRTGDTIVSLASSASVLYYSDTVIYSDNTSEKISIKALPYPNFENGKKLVMQRGSGICTVKSTPEREKACITFLKWLTDAKKNSEWVTELGYMPVKAEAYEKYLPEELAKLTNPKYKSLYEVFQKVQREYEFYVSPKIYDYLDMEDRFEDMVRTKLSVSRDKFLKNDVTEQTLVEQSLKEFQRDYVK